MVKKKAGAPLGNKNAVGHGRPPTFSDEKVIEMGEHLLTWMKETDKAEDWTVVHLSQWYSEKQGISSSQWKNLTDRDCFRSYWEKARDWMGKRIMQNPKLAPSYGNRFLAMYCKDLHTFEEAVKDREAERKKREDQTPPMDEQLNIALDLMKKLKSAEEEIEKLKAALDLKED